ncbi:hypothetical protein TURU_012478 [Turdus rufiventris]|nr:hypothetical protein TURU_012478 [Turdus rufiventris]
MGHITLSQTPFQNPELPGATPSRGSEHASVNFGCFDIFGVAADSTDRIVSAAKCHLVGMTRRFGSSELPIPSLTFLGYTMATITAFLNLAFPSAFQAAEEGSSHTAAQLQEQLQVPYQTVVLDSCHVPYPSINHIPGNKTGVGLELKGKHFCQRHFAGANSLKIQDSALHGTEFDLCQVQSKTGSGGIQKGKEGKNNNNKKKSPGKEIGLCLTNKKKPAKLKLTSQAKASKQASKQTRASPSKQNLASQAQTMGERSQLISRPKKPSLKQNTRLGIQATIKSRQDISLEFKTDTEKEVDQSGASTALQFKYIPVFTYKFTSLVPFIHRELL